MSVNILLLRPSLFLPVNSGEWPGEIFLGPCKVTFWFRGRGRGIFLWQIATVYSVAVRIGVHTCIWQMCSCAQILADYISYDTVFLFLLDRQAWPNAPPDSVPALRFTPSVGVVWQSMTGAGQTIAMIVL